MTNTFPPLAQRLASYPELRRALGDGWIRQHEPIDPVHEDHPIARWLRSNSGIAAGYLPVLEQVLEIIQDVLGIADWRRRLRSDTFAVWDTIAELYLAAWLKGCNVDFTHPKSGADFLITLAEGEVLPLEVTAPRTTVIFNSLFERLAFAGGRLGFAGEIRHTLGSYATFSALTPTAARQVVRDQLAQLQQALQAGTEEMDRDYPQFGFALHWRREAHPAFVGTGTFLGATPEGGLCVVLDALRERHKREQLGKIPGAFGVVVEVGQAEAAWIHPLLAHLRLRDFTPDWSWLPAELRNLRYLIIYSVSLDRIPPFECHVLVNPACPLPAPAGFAALQKLVFPETDVEDS